MAAWQSWQQGRAAHAETLEKLLSAHRIHGFHYLALSLIALHKGEGPWTDADSPRGPGRGARILCHGPSAQRAAVGRLLPAAVAGGPRPELGRSLPHGTIPGWKTLRRPTAATRPILPLRRIRPNAMSRPNVSSPSRSSKRRPAAMRQKRKSCSKRALPSRSLLPKMIAVPDRRTIATSTTATESCVCAGIEGPRNFGDVFAPEGPVKIAQRFIAGAGFPQAFI